MMMMSRSHLFPGSIKPLHQKTPSRNASTVSAFKAAGWQADGKCLEGILENLFGNPEIPQS